MSSLNKFLHNTQFAYRSSIVIENTYNLPRVITRTNSQAHCGAAESIHHIFHPIFHPYLEWKSWRRAAKLSGLPSRCFSNKLAKILFVREKGGRHRKGSRIRRSTWLEKPGSERRTAMRLALNNAERVHSRTTACLRTFDSESTFVNSLSFIYFVSCSETQLKRRRIAVLMKFFINRFSFGSRALRDPNT